MTTHPYDILLITPSAYYIAARGAYASVTGNPADASAEWLELTDGTLDDEGAPVVTHRACHTGARESTRQALPMLAAQIPGSSWHVTREGIGTNAEAEVTTVVSVLEGLGLERVITQEDL